MKAIISARGVENTLRKKYTKGQVWRFGGPTGELYYIRSVDSVNKTVELMYADPATAAVNGRPDSLYPMKYMDDISMWELVSHPEPTKKDLRRWLNAVW
jgi:hypothetical protein